MREALEPEGRYLYCVTEAVDTDLGKIGLRNSKVFPVLYRDLVGVVSSIAYESLEASLPDILVHQKVVEACWSKGTTLPVRFGVIFKNENGVRQMLAKSYEEYKAKLTNLEKKDEYGAKVIISEEGLKKIKQGIESQSEEVGKLKKVVAKSTRGTSYLLKIKMDEALRNETAKTIEELAKNVHTDLTKAALQSALLKSDHEQIALNAAYLVPRGQRKEFEAQVVAVKRRYESEGVGIHLSGPWAPYSFC